MAMIAREKRQTRQGESRDVDTLVLSTIAYALQSIPWPHSCCGPWLHMCMYRAPQTDMGARQSYCCGSVLRQ